MILFSFNIASFIQIPCLKLVHVGKGVKASFLFFNFIFIKSLIYLDLKKLVMNAVKTNTY